MRSGRLRAKVSLERRSATKSSLGEPLNTFAEIAVRRAGIEPLMGKEYYTNSGEHSQITTRIRIRHDSTVGSLKPYDRVVDYSESPGVIYDIESVQNPKEKDRELVLMCKRDA